MCSLSRGTSSSRSTLPGARPSAKVSLSSNPSVLRDTAADAYTTELTDAIQEHWGSRPFTDLSLGWQHALKLYPSIDASRAVAAGASWGGYAINWIQGHQSDLDFSFKALFCHDGVFDATYNGFSTDELYFFQQEWGGRPWDTKAKEILKKYNAREFVERWRTPMLIVHGSRDFRLAETEGIAAYHALKQYVLCFEVVCVCQW